MEYNQNELTHYGVKGMKWGHRKNPDQGLSQKKAAYRQAKKDYNKSFNKAYNRAIAAYSPIKKHRQANDARWEDAVNKAQTLNKAKAEYKSAKKAVKADSKARRQAERAMAKLEKQQMKDFVKQRSKEIQKGESAVGKIWNAVTDGHKIQAELEWNLRKYDDRPRGNI